MDIDVVKALGIGICEASGQRFLLLGQDADTTAAICGQIAGAFYGEADIPASWRNQLTLGPEIAKLADQLLAGRVSLNKPVAPSASTQGDDYEQEEKEQTDVAFGARRKKVD